MDIDLFFDRLEGRDWKYIDKFRLRSSIRLVVNPSYKATFGVAEVDLYSTLSVYFSEKLR